MSNELIFVEVEHGDWCGIYVNDKLQVSGHSIPDFAWIDMINAFHNFSQATSYSVSSSYLEDIGELPDKFSDIPRSELSK